MNTGLVPRNRLLFWIAATVLPFSLLAALEPAATGLSLIPISGLIALALADAFAARGGLANISIETPAVARMSKDREAKLELRIRNQRQKPRTLVVGLPLPPEIQSVHEDTHVA